MVSPIHARFDEGEFPEDLQWFCEPSRWELREGEGLLLWPDSKTDFWQRTHYGFQADNGHLFHVPLEGDFVLETAVSFEGLHQYDQAGLMLRGTPDFWLKCSVEHEPEGPNRLGAVVTRGGYSDWSTQDVEREWQRWWFRITRTASDCFVEASRNGAVWSQIRLAHLPAGEPVQAGLYACSPKESGFVACFHFLRISVPESAG